MHDDRSHSAHSDQPSDDATPVSATRAPASESAHAVSVSRKRLLRLSPADRSGPPPTCPGCKHASPFSLTPHAWILAAASVAITGLTSWIVLELGYDLAFAFGMEIVAIALMLIVAFITARFTRHYQAMCQQASDAQRKAGGNDEKNACHAPFAAQCCCPYSPHAADAAKPQRRSAGDAIRRTFSRTPAESPIEARCRQLARVFDLSERETEVLTLLARGLNRQEIEQTLVVSTNTVKSHQRNIYRKLDIHSRDELNRLFDRQRALIQDYELMRRQTSPKSPTHLGS